MPAERLRLSHLPRTAEAPASQPALAGPNLCISDDALASHLLTHGLALPHVVLACLADVAAQGGNLADRLLSQGHLSDADLCRAFADLTGLVQLAPSEWAVDPRGVDRLGAVRCLALGVLPLTDMGTATVVLAARPQTFVDHHAVLVQALGPVRPALAPANQIEAALLDLRGTSMDRAARQYVAANESCRNWGAGKAASLLLVFLLATLAGAFLWPMAMAYAFTAWAIATLFLATLLKGAAAFAALRAPPPEPPLPAIARLPTVSIMVALYHEADIAARLIRRLGRLDYPHDLLDIVLVVEEHDMITRNALRQAGLPSWIRVVPVPDGKLKTKPRALNHALQVCRGSIIGIYDAEDAPAADQIRRVVDRFYARPAEVACLQGVLDFYNPRTNWLSRCFTIEYATWFRIILPGLQRLGFAIPLGGTTLFFRREALESLGAWDAYNVTEDADLGMRLARHGYRTEVIDTVTEEEANCRTIPWIRQRSRWLKGYMMTYAVHMRAPRLLLRQMGWWKFMGFQVFFLTTLSQFLLAPVLWTFWAVPLGLPHPVSDTLSHGMHLAIFGIYILTEAVLLVVGVMALRLTPNKVNPLWVPTLHFYFPLGALASYKAAWELVTRPFWWDKTSHGLFHPKDSTQ
jgi:glycosyltransferase XagB